MLGDWNCDLNRDKRFDKLLKSFLSKNEILDCHSLFDSKLDFTYKKKDYKSRIDHIFIRSCEKKLIKEYDVMDEPLNLSDHNPIYIEIDTKTVNNFNSSETTSVNFHHFDWKDKVFNETYQRFLNHNLDYLVSKVKEIKASFNKLAYVHLIDEIFFNLPRIFLKSARQAEKMLKKSTRKKRHPNCNLNENAQVNELLEETRQLYAEFETSNYNDSEIRKQINLQKKKFKHLVRKISYEQEKKMSVNLSNLKNMSNPKFWRTIAKFRRNRACVNNCSKEIGLVDFANFYSDLFSHNGKVNSSKQNDIKDSVKGYHLDIMDQVYDDVTDEEEIECIIQKLSGNKSAGLDNICNEFFINGVCSNLMYILSWYFNKAICFGYIPSNFNISVVTPIPKKGTMSSPSGFRPVSVSSTMAVILENIILNKMECLSCIHKNQFGYKKKLSSKHAYFLVNEVVNYYKKNGSKIHVLSLDATKAFDKMWRVGLFFKLIGKVSRPIWRILYNYYNVSKIVVKYDGQLSDVLQCTEGVKQGGVLSPYLFNFFINELIENCTNFNIGASLNGLNLSIIAYCDDIIILSPSYGHAMKLLDECFKFANDWKMEFNPRKSVCLTMTNSGVECQEKFEINNVQLLNVEGFEYLGLPFGSNSFISNFIEEKWKKVEKSLYSLYGLGCKPMVSSPYLIAFLFKQYCQSIFRHILDNILIPNSMLSELDTRQNLLIKRIIGLKKFTHVSPLYDALKLESVSEIYFKHKIYFLEQLMRCPLCKEVFLFIRGSQSTSDKKNTSFCIQLNRLEKRLFINCLEYESKIVKALISFSFKSVKMGLVDSVKFVVSSITYYMETNQEF